MCLSHSYKALKLDCKHRVKILADEMIKAGETFEIWYGIYPPTPHVWIEQNGVILDPTIYHNDLNKYKKQKLIDIIELNDIIEYYRKK